jgi:hypothetical protein
LTIEIIYWYNSLIVYFVYVEEAIESYSLFLIVTKELNVKKKLERIC